MIFNQTHKLSKYIAPPSQEDIYNCPHYFGMSVEQVKKSGAPEFIQYFQTKYLISGVRHFFPTI